MNSSQFQKLNLRVGGSRNQHIGQLIQMAPDNSLLSNRNELMDIPAQVTLQNLAFGLHHHALSTGS